MWRIVIEKERKYFYILLQQFTFSRHWRIKISHVIISRLSRQRDNNRHGFIRRNVCGKKYHLFDGEVSYVNTWESCERPALYAGRTPSTGVKMTEYSLYFVRESGKFLVFSHLCIFFLSRSPSFIYIIQFNIALIDRINFFKSR